ncbi:DUF1990 family protein [Glaciibacter psychrotolerans]|uniref:Uncharacterized protein (UPF0548 family) n=1 Tax=Glaciibacter psychrotolerans TaxID=670054 RepID=A0A7Z0J592_9MICO|nr:DUF1990 domain-containing protein [Leifsonia psychrotolerans]NYJ18861.1 uncharacterized protein (UPF0548 family) [Leifsonia psychrotolerans]
MRRATFTDASVTYGAIGGTLADDLMIYPPPGTRPAEHIVKLGSGEERFHAAAASLMSWGVQRGSGIEVTDFEAGTGVEYTGIVFDEYGIPSRDQSHPVNEATFGEDGTPYISNGMTAKLHIKAGPFTVVAPVRVVYVIDEANRIGFAYGTMAGHPESGEVSFIVERHDDDTVWLAIRSFSQPSNWKYTLATPYLRYQQKRYTKRYLRALHPSSGA